MRSWTLAAALALAAPAFAAPAPAADARQKALDEIAAWRGFLPRANPPSPLTTAFEPRLDAVEAAFKAADPAALAKPRRDFEAWQRDFIVARCKAMPAGCETASQLRAFSVAQRSSVADFARQRAEFMDPKIRQARAAEGPGARLFYDNDTRQAAAIVLPGSFGSPPPVARFNAQSQTPSLSTVQAPPPPPASKPFSLAALADWFDYGGISDKAIRAVESIKNEVAGYGKLLSGFAGSCYYGAKWLMIKAGMLPPEVRSPGEIGNIGIGSGHAYMMNAALKRDPSLQAKLHVRALRLADIADAEVKRIPEKTMFVFDRGCAGMSGESGHIEIKFDDDKMSELPAAAFYRSGRRGPAYKPTVGSDQVLACSDGCMLHTAAYLRTYGRQGCLNAYVPVLDRPAPPPVAAVPGI